jgi:hypothetical protein
MLHLQGYCVVLWLPQIMTPFTAPGLTASRFATCAVARFWSKRVSAVKFSRGMLGAAFIAISAFVFAGLPTTNTFTSRAANALIAAPCTRKMAALRGSRSLRSMPGPRGRAPTNNAMFAPSNARSGSVKLCAAANKTTTRLQHVLAGCLFENRHTN